MEAPRIDMDLEAIKDMIQEEYKVQEIKVNKEELISSRHPNIHLDV